MTDNILLPITLSIADYNIDFGLISVVLFVIIFVSSIYQSLIKRVETFEIFDFGFKTILIMVLIARLLAVINNPNYYLADLSQILNFQDGKFFYPGLILGLILSVFFMSSSLAKKVGYMKLLDIAIRAYAYSAVWLLLGFFLSARSLGVQFEGAIGVKYLDGGLRFPSSLIQAIYTLVGIIILTVWPNIKTKSGITAAIFVMLYSALEFILRFFSNGYDPVILGFIDLYQFFYLIFLTFSILIFIRINQILKLDAQEQFMENDLTSVRAKFDVSGFKKERVSAKELFSLSYGSAINNKQDRPTRAAK
ncbi:MAG TPA: prolipoprotein diacylglyceryl transferase [Candidatus Dojkabacteria bacterium]|nr:prolipoprotein diacylglyceryl transferase [Candidatus Dojkabacteria bacterium]